MYNELKFAGVYKITNTENGDFYIGSSVHVYRRWQSHLRFFKLKNPTKKSILYSAVHKYGLDKFKIEILETCEPERDILLTREQYYLDTLNPKYNIYKTAFSSLGSKRPNLKGKERNWVNVTKEEYSQRRKEEVANGINPPPTGSGESNNFYGKNHTEEAKQKMREGNVRAREKAIEERGYYMSPEAKESMKNKIQESLTPEKRKWFREKTKESTALGRAKIQKEAEDFAKQYVSLIEDKQHEGMNLREIARVFNSEGHKTRLGNDWTDQSIREVLKKFGKQPTGENSNNFRVLQEQKKQADDFAKKFIDIIRLKQKEGLAIVEIADFLNSQGYKTRRNKDWAELAVRQILKRFPDQQSKRKTIKPDIDPRPQIIHNKKILGWDKTI